MARRYHVVVCERERAIRRGLGRVLHELGCRVTECEDGPAALTAIAIPSTDALVCDYTVRAPSGTGLLREARVARPDLVRILWTQAEDVYLGASALSEGLVHRICTDRGDMVAAARTVVLALHTLRPRGVEAQVGRGPRSERPPTAILVADPDPETRGAMSRLLRSHGFDAIEAADGAAALMLTVEKTPRVAVVDLALPDVDGLRIVEFMKKNYAAAIAVIAVAASRDPAVEDAAFVAGAEEIVCRPVPMLRLVRRVDAFEQAQRAYSDLQRIAERAERLRRFGAEAASLIAHDLNNGLGVALPNLDYVLDTVDLGSDQREALESSRAALRAMTWLIRDFVQLEQLEDDVFRARPARTAVAALLATVAESYQASLTARDVGIRVECAAELTASVDADLAARILHNLVGNAARFVPRGGTIRVAAHLEAAGEHAQLVLAVGNSGPPIPDEVAATLFERNRTGGHRRSKTGLGLYFCRLASEGHGGGIALAPTDEYPANFEVRLRTAPDAAVAAEPAAQAMGSLRVPAVQPPDESGRMRSASSRLRLVGGDST